MKKRYVFLCIVPIFLAVGTTVGLMLGYKVGAGYNNKITSGLGPNGLGPQNPEGPGQGQNPQPTPPPVDPDKPTPQPEPVPPTPPQPEPTPPPQPQDQTTTTIADTLAFNPTPSFKPSEWNEHQDLIKQAIIDQNIVKNLAPNTTLTIDDITLDSPTDINDAEGTIKLNVTISEAKAVENGQPKAISKIISISNLAKDLDITYPIMGKVDAMGIFEREMSIPKSRQKNNEFYDDATLLINKFKGSNPEFKYPSWNYNYRDNNGQNSIINHNGSSIELQNEILNEKTPDGKRYADPTFIKEQIKAGTLKKHPYTKYQYETNIENINSVVDTTFNLDTSFPGWYPLGLYAAPGEIVEIQLDEETWANYEKTSEQPFSVEINHNFWDHMYGVDTGWGANKVSKRYPYLKTNFSLAKAEFDPATRTIKIGSPFGGNLSININKWRKDAFTTHSTPLKFTVKNAIPTLYYVHDKTTESEWNEQINKMKNNQLAPSFDAIFTYGSMSIPFTKADEIGGVNLAKIVYPKATFDKVNDFLFLSNYFSSRDIDGDIRKLDLQFNYDVWDEAVGWGGGDTLWCDSNTGATSFLIGTDDPNWWSFGANWLTFHEINHNYEEDEVLFKFIPGKMHGQTNQVNLFDYAMQGDIGRWRNEWNVYGEQNNAKKGHNSIGWSRLASAFSDMYYFNEPYYNKPADPNNLAGPWTGNRADEYDLYNMLMNVYGPMGYAEYVRWANKNFKSKDNPNWTYMKQIESLSQFFGINLWPAINKMTNRLWTEESPLWNYGALGPTNRWPESYNSATSEEKAIIDNLARNYKAIDFVSNLYACGSYIYDAKTNDFKYNGDMLPAYEIAPGQPLTLNLDQFILSMNPYFDWNNVEFTTPKYGSIKPDASNPKKLIYTPSTQHLAEIDEFDLTIHPTNFTNKEANYVPAYKWKVKIRQNVNSIHFKVSDLLADQKLWENTDTMFDRITQEANWLGEWNYHSFNQWFFDDIEKKWKKQGLNATFRFVALESGTYDFDFKFANCMRIKINGQNEYSYVIPEQSYLTTHNHKFSKQLNKGDSLLFEIDLITNNNNPYDAPGQLALNVSLNNQPINYLKNILSPFVDGLNVEANYIDYLTKPEYAYKRREVDYSIFKNNSIAKFALTPDYENKIEYVEIRSKQFKTDITGYYDPNSDNAASTQWFNEDLNGNNYATVTTKNPYSIWMDFDTPTQIGSVVFQNDLPYPYLPTNLNDRPSHIKVEITDFDGSASIAFDDEYGKAFNDKAKAQTIVPLNKTYTNVKSIKLTISNTKSNTIQFKRLDFNKYPIQIVNVKDILTFDHIANKSSGWETKTNDKNQNLSNLNNTYYQSNTQGSYLEFKIKGYKGLGIVGRSHATDSLVDIYVDNKLVDTSLATDHQMRFNYLTYLNMNLLDPNKAHTIKIVQKENKPLMINYLTLF